MALRGNQVIDFSVIAIRDSAFLNGHHRRTRATIQKLPYQARPDIS
jgi:hypothetical protein